MHSGISQTAREGLALLKGGALALKHGRAGKPHVTVFTLSADEETLSWKPAHRSSNVLHLRREVVLLGAGAACR